jgi:hypothetical protein
VYPQDQQLSTDAFSPESLTAFYRQYNPSKIADIELILVQYSSENLMQALIKEYGVSTVVDFFNDFAETDDIYGADLHEDINQHGCTDHMPLSQQTLVDEELRRATEGLPEEVLEMLRES